jgi:hypothetical protein
LKKKTLFLYLIPLFLASSVAFSDEGEDTSTIKKDEIPVPKIHTLPRERTQYFWQPLKGLSSFTLSASEENYNTTNTNAGVVSNVTQLTPDYSLTYTYGLSNLWAAGITVSTSPTQTSTTANGITIDSSTGGPNNVVLFLKNTTPLSNRWNLHYGMSVSLSLDVEQPSEAGSQGNNFTGGDGVTPYIGTSYNIFGRSFLGCRAEYNYTGTRTVDPNRSISNARQKSGGNTATGSGFFEWHTGQWILDSSGNMNWNDANQTILTQSEESTDPYWSYSETVGVEYYFTKGFMARIQGTLSQVSEIDSSTTVQSSHDETTGTMILRDEF